MSGDWIGVDLDGTLARSDDSVSPGEIGEPIPAMVDRVKVWLANGEDVRLFTARAKDASNDELDEIDDWCLLHIGQTLVITYEKDKRMKVLYDDRAVQVVRNTGELVGEAHDAI